MRGTGWLTGTALLAVLVHVAPHGGSAARGTTQTQTSPTTRAARWDSRPTSQRTEPTLIRGARVFEGAAVHEDTDVLVAEGRIARIGRGLTAPAGAVVVDGRGRTLLPGLIDGHTHTFGDVLRESLVFGVTTSLDMFTDVRTVRALRAEEQADGAPSRAALFSAGTLVTAPGGHGTQFGVPIPTFTADSSAQAFVDARIAEGSDWIKIVYDDGHTFGLTRPTVTRAQLRALIEAAQRRERLAVVHVSTARTAYDAIEAGANGLVHLFTDTLPAAGFAALMKARGAFAVPTLVVLKSITGVGGSAPLLEDARITPFLTGASRAQLTQAFPAQDDADVRYGYARATVALLHRAGVPIVAGTDAPNPGTAHGASMHRELELLVEAGLTPTEALAAATSVPARVFRLSDRGRIAPGLRADLVLVNGDATRDITATRAIEGVWKAGVRLDRTAYAQTVANAARHAASARESGLIADFERGSTDALFGAGLYENTDSYAGGTSTVRMTLLDGGAAGSTRALRMAGTITAVVPYAWAGIMWSPGTQPMAPADLSARRGVSFQARGDERMYRVLVFAESRGMMPLTKEFTAGAEWRQIDVAWSDLGLDGRGIMAVLIVGGPQPGTFTLDVDDVRLR